MMWIIFYQLCSCIGKKDIHREHKNERKKEVQYGSEKNFIKFKYLRGRISICPVPEFHESGGSPRKNTLSPWLKFALKVGVSKAWKITVIDASWFAFVFPFEGWSALGGSSSQAVFWASDVAVKLSSTVPSSLGLLVFPVASLSPLLFK